MKYFRILRVISKNIMNNFQLFIYFLKFNYSIICRRHFFVLKAFSKSYTEQTVSNFLISYKYFMNSIKRFLKVFLNQEIQHKRLKVI